MKDMLFQRLTTRFQIRTPVQTHAADGGADLKFEVRAIIWGSLEPISTRQKIGVYTRDVQREDIPTHIIIFRVNEELGITRSELTSPDFIWLDEGGGEGRSFRILSPVDVGEAGKYLEVLAMEIETEDGADGLVAP
jgi:hypothetical protein